MEQELENLIDEYFNNSAFFKTGFSLSSLKDSTKKIKLTIDADNPVSIDDCTRINKDLYKKIMQSGLLDNFELEVTSAGIGEPLKFKRQYYKNKGRKLSFYLDNGQTKEGVLKDIRDNSVIIEDNKSGKGKNKTGSKSETEIFFEQIKKAKVEISFS